MKVAEELGLQKFIDLADIQTELLQDVSVFPEAKGTKSKLCSLTLKVCTGGILYLVNPSDQADSNATITNGSLLVGYGKGKWINKSVGDDNEIKYELDDSKQTVIFNGNQTTVGTLVVGKRMNSEGDLSRICYHDIIEDPTDEDTCAFNLRVAQQVFYVVTDVVVKREHRPMPVEIAPLPKAIQAHAASLLPMEQWNAEFTTFHLVVKWQCKKGLQPIRPQITWTGPDTTIPAGKAMLLQQLESN